MSLRTCKQRSSAHTHVCNIVITCACVVYMYMYMYMYVLYMYMYMLSCLLYTVQLSVRSVSKYKMYRIRPLTGCSAPEIDTNYHGTMVGCSLFNYCSCMMIDV